MLRRQQHIMPPLQPRPITRQRRRTTPQGQLITLQRPPIMLQRLLTMPRPPTRCLTTGEACLAAIAQLEPLFTLRTRVRASTKSIASNCDAEILDRPLNRSIVERSYPALSSMGQKSEIDFIETKI